MKTMLNDNFKAEKKETVEFPPLPKDMYTVEFLDVTSKENVTYDTKNLPDDQKQYETILDFQFVLLEGTENGKSLRGRSVFANFVPSYLYISKKHGKNKLYQIVEALQGQQLSPEQEAYGITGKDLNALIGKQCRIVTVNKTSGDSTYSNIDRFLVAKEKYDALTSDEKEKSRVKKEGKEETKETDDIPELTDEDMPSF